MRIAKGKLQGHKLLVHGGPWDREFVFIPRGGTMVFRVGPYHGHYTSTGEWKDVRPS